MQMTLLLVYLIFPVFITVQRTCIDNDYENGWAESDAKVGVWEYYEEGKLKLKVNYSEGILEYLAPDTNQYAIKGGEE